MARLRREPEVIGDMPVSEEQAARPQRTRRAAKVACCTTPGHHTVRDSPGFSLWEDSDAIDGRSESVRRLVPKRKTPVTVRSRQVRLAPPSTSRLVGEDEILPRNERLSRPTPRRFLQLREQPSKRLNHIRATDTSSDSETHASDSDDNENSVEIPGTDEEQLEQSRSIVAEARIVSGTSRQVSTKRAGRGERPLDLAEELQALSIVGSLPAPNIAPPKRPMFQPPRRDHGADSSSEKENVDAIIHFTPPTIRTIGRHDRPTTPPAALESPSKGRLQSPSKRRLRVPTPPGRPSLGAFWAADVVNDWNDQHSPQKVLKSPRKLKFLSLDSDDDDGSAAKASVSSSPQKTNSKAESSSPSKRAFNATKHALAEAFLRELDEKITDGQIARLTASTGGIQLTWSKTLNKTAGRAHWRREHTKVAAVESPPAGGSDDPSSSSFSSVDESGNNPPRKRISTDHVSIELAEKVITDEARLLNTLAHEFCHLANYVVSGVRDQPHGAEFKRWGRLCTTAFAHRGVEVTTKHTYDIEYKYVWQCSNEDCGVEFKRHSKSIDPARHTCGSCRARLVQIKPAPRRTAQAAAAAQGGGGRAPPPPAMRDT